jgi:hypothetical protein
MMNLWLTTVLHAYPVAVKSRYAKDDNLEESAVKYVVVAVGVGRLAPAT